MEVITIESQAYLRLEAMFIESQKNIKELSEEVLKSKIGLLSAKQVADMIGCDEKTIRIKKADIGYSIPMGKNIMFKVDDINAWINKGYRAPRARKKL